MTENQNASGPAPRIARIMGDEPAYESDPLDPSAENAYGQPDDEDIEDDGHDGCGIDSEDVQDGLFGILEAVRYELEDGDDDFLLDEQRAFFTNVQDIVRFPGEWLTNDKGFAVYMNDGSVFTVSIVKARNSY